MPDTTSTFIPFFAPGDQVTHPQLPGKVLVVKRVKQTRAIVVPADDLTSRGYDPNLHHLTYATDANGERLPRVTLPSEDEVATDANAPRPAQVIRLNRAYRHWTTQDLMVVVSVNQTTVTAMKLGGENNPGVRVPFGAFTVVDVSTLILAV